MERVRCYTSPALDARYPETWPAEVRVRLRTGQVLERRAEGARGSPARPASWAEVQEKAAGLIGADEARALASHCRQFGGGGGEFRGGGAALA
jgi:2-methylcitrate dehydratase PrpD